MIKDLVEGVSLTPLRILKSEFGAVMHHINYQSNTFIEFQEAYISKTNYNQIKAWKLHKEMVQNICISYGAFKFVLFDNREFSSTKGLINEIIIDDDLNYNLLTIPFGIWYGFQCISKPFGLINNVTNCLHNPNEVLRLDMNHNLINYNWEI